MKRIWLVVASMALAACGNTTTEPGDESSNAVNGKADVVAGADEEFICHWDVKWVAETSGELADLVTGEEQYAPADADQLPVVLERQIIRAVSWGTDDLDKIDIAEAFERVDGGEIYRAEMTLADSTQAEWIQFWSGDTEVGLIFEPGTIRPLAEIGDGEVMGCGSTSAPATPAQLTCDWDIPFAGGVDSSETLDEATTATFEATQANADELTELQSNQIYLSLLHQTAIIGDEDFDVVFDAVDEGQIFINTVVLDGTSYDWVQYWSGDTEVGSVYNSGTVEMVAEIGDGDILGCTADATEPDPDPTPVVTEPGSFMCSYDTAFGADSSADLRDARVGAPQRLTADDLGTIDELTSTQIFDAAKHLTFLNGDEDFDAVFEVADGGEFFVEVVDLSGTSYDWIRFYAGDTEVGVLFERGTQVITAEVSDGDILGCTAE